MSENAPDTEALVFEVLAKFADAQGTKLTLETELGADLALDSMRIMEVMLELEDRLDISIPQNILPNLRTLGDLARELESLTAS